MIRGGGYACLAQRCRGTARRGTRAQLRHRDLPKGKHLFNIPNICNAHNMMTCHVYAIWIAMHLGIPLIGVQIPFMKPIAFLNYFKSCTQVGS